MKLTYHTYKRLLAYTRPYLFRLTLGILAGILAGGSMLGIFTMSGDVLKPFASSIDGPAATDDSAPATASPARVQEPEPVAETDGPEKALSSELSLPAQLAERIGVPPTRPDGTLTWQFFLLSVLALPLLAAFKAFNTYVNHYYMRWVGARVVHDVRNNLFGTLQQQSLKFYGRCDIGNLISHCTTDAQTIENAISQTVADLTRAPVEIMAAVGFILYMSIKHQFFGILALMLVGFPLVVLPIVIIGRRIKRYTHAALSRISDLISRMQENFTGIRVVKAYHMEEAELRRFADMNGRYFRTVIRALRAELSIAPIMESIGAISVVLGLVFCYARGIRLDQIGPIAFAAFSIYRPVKQLAKVNVNLQRSMAAAERLFDLLDTDTAIPEAENPVRLEQFNDTVSFANVNFSYDENEPRILNNISFDLKRGHVIAFVGQTGSGKTTIANLLARFYDPSEGRITLDGYDLRELEIKSLRRLIGIVTQETILFNDTIATNIAYGTENATEAEIVEAAKKANAHEFIMANPEGYDRVVGEKGFVLSGGQRQRVAIARAILKNPPILILDEATSALDTVTERLVQEALARLMENRTVFAIAHRLSTIKHADQIYVIDNGNIIENGTHDELYGANGNYRQLCDMQFS